MPQPEDLAARVGAALRGAIAAHPSQAAEAAQDMLTVAEALAASGRQDVDALPQLPAASGAGLLVRVLPFGLATPMDRPRLRRDAYRCASAAGADEGTAIVCVAAALVAADLLRFDAGTTAIRVRQSLLEDAPMALLHRISVLDGNGEVEAATESDPGAALQVALSVIEWTAAAGVAAALARLGEAGRGELGALTGALAGAAAGECDVPVDGPLAERADRAAASLALLGADAASAPGVARSHEG